MLRHQASALPPKAAAMLGFMMGWPQLVTGLAGILLARLLVARLQFKKI